MAAIYMWFVSAETVLTTTLYPIEMLPGVSISPVLLQLAMRDIPEDTINADFAFVGGLLRVLLKSTGPYEDTINADFAFVSGELRQLLKSTTLPEDTINADFDFVGGELEQILIETQIYPHGVDITPALLSLNMVNV
jgi:hypothetical protein